MAAPRGPRVCYLSRRRGWVDPEDPRRPASEVNVLAIALGSRVWTLDTAWDSIFHRTATLAVAHAFRNAMARAPLTDSEVEILRDLAAQVHVELHVLD